MISVIIQGRGDVMANVKRSISCFLKQTHKDKELILVIDQLFTPQSYDDRIHEALDGNLDLLTTHNIRIFSELNATFTHNNVGSMRNFGAQQARGGYILFMDDDEDIHADYLTKNLEYRNKYRKILGKDFVLTPTLMYRHTGAIQNQGFSHFNYWFSRPIVYFLGQREYAEIQMYSGNSLFAPAVIFQQHKMDERFDFIYEDLAYSHSLHKAGYPILVTKNIKIYHMERDKTKLDEAWIGNVYQAHRKSRHRILFVRTFATFWQKCQFFILGFRGQPLRLILKVLLNKPQNKWPIIKNIWKGTIEGCFMK